MPQNIIPPWIPSYYTSQEEALIAGFLLKSRQAILNALQTVRSGPADQVPNWQGPLLEYYQAAEAYSRYLLWLAHYPTEKDQMWNG